jgi:hypothetical protein
MHTDHARLQLSSPLVQSTTISYHKPANHSPASSGTSMHYFLHTASPLLLLRTGSGLVWLWLWLLVVPGLMLWGWWRVLPCGCCLLLLRMVMVVQCRALTWQPQPPCRQSISSTGHTCQQQQCWWLAATRDDGATVPCTDMAASISLQGSMSVKDTAAHVTWQHMKQTLQVMLTPKHQNKQPDITRCAM